MNKFHLAHHSKLVFLKSIICLNFLSFFLSLLKVSQSFKLKTDINQFSFLANYFSDIIRRKRKLSRSNERAKSY